MYATIEPCYSHTRLGTTGPNLTEAARRTSFRVQGGGLERNVRCMCTGIRSKSQNLLEGWLTCKRLQGHHPLNPVHDTCTSPLCQHLPGCLAGQWGFTQERVGSTTNFKLICNAKPSGFQVSGLVLCPHSGANTRSNMHRQRDRERAKLCLGQEWGETVAANMGKLRERLRNRRTEDTLKS